MAAHGLIAAPERRLWFRIDPGGWQKTKTGILVLEFARCKQYHHFFSIRVWRSMPLIIKGGRTDVIRVATEVWEGAFKMSLKDIPNCCDYREKKNNAILACYR